MITRIADAIVDRQVDLATRPPRKRDLVLGAGLVVAGAFGWALLERFSEALFRQAREAYADVREAGELVFESVRPDEDPGYPTADDLNPLHHSDPE